MRKYDRINQNLKICFPTEKQETFFFLFICLQPFVVKGLTQTSLNGQVIVQTNRVVLATVPHALQEW